jgi:hypothetical protein
MTDSLIQEAREAFQLCIDNEADNRAEALDDIRFARLAEQWPKDVLAKRLRDGRPCLTINRLPAFIRQVVNDARQNKPSITVHPADSGADPATADIISGLIRNIEYASDADVAYDTALESAVTGGLGYFRIGLDYARDDGFEQDIRIQRIADPFSVYADPHSTAADSADWNLGFVVEAMPRTLFEKRFKGAQKVDWNSDYHGVGSPWLDGDRVLVAEYWTREEVPARLLGLSDGQAVEAAVYEARKAEFEALGLSVVADRAIRSRRVRQRLLTGAEVLDEIDWPGRFIPIVPVFGEELTVEGKRHFRSLVRDAKDPQRMFNYWRTASTELVALSPKAPFIGPRGAFDTDVEKWSTANVETHAFIEYDGPQPPQRQGFDGPPAGALQEAINAADDMKAISGLHEAALGMPGNETSGRAITARQREGDVSTFHYIDNLSRSIRHAGRILIDLIPRVYSAPRLVRVLGPEGAPRVVALNQPTAGEGGSLRVYDLGLGKYDVTVEAGPSYTTRRQEAAEQMMAFVRVFPQAAPVIGDLLARNLDWPGSAEIARRLAALLPGPSGGAGSGAAEAQVEAAARSQIAALGAQLHRAVEALRDKAADRELEAEKLRIEARRTGIKAFEAVTQRMAAGRERG